MFGTGMNMIILASIIQIEMEEDRFLAHQNYKQLSWVYQKLGIAGIASLYDKFKNRL